MSNVWLTAAFYFPQQIKVEVDNCSAYSNWFGDKDNKNTLMSTSLCREKHQSLGVLIKNQLWQSLLERKSTLQCLCVHVNLKEFSIKENEVLSLMINNVSSINLANNHVAHRGRKHIKMRFYYLRELMSEVKLKLGYCKSEE